MKPISILAIVTSLLASGGYADVSRLDLVPMKKNLTGAIMSEYQYEGFTHSVLIEVTTDYGDTVPYLFTCQAPSVQCVMDFEGDDYRYLLDVGENTVSIVTQGVDDYINIDVFEIVQ